STRMKPSPTLRYVLRTLPKVQHLGSQPNVSASLGASHVRNSWLLPACISTIRDWLSCMVAPRAIPTQLYASERGMPDSYMACPDSCSAIMIANRMLESYRVVIRTSPGDSVSVKGCGTSSMRLLRGSLSTHPRIL